MRAPLCVREAFLSALRRPLRSCLVLQAIVWGSAAIVFPQAIYQGSRNAAFTRAAEFAADRIIISTPDGPVFSSWDEIPALAGQLTAVDSITGISLERAGGLDVLGSDGAILAARRLELAEGRDFNAAELADGSPVCILEARAAAKLFPEGSALGGEVPLDDGRRLRVIGVLSPRPESVLRTNQLGYDEGHMFGSLVKVLFTYMGIDPVGIEWLNGESCVIVPWRLLGGPPQWVLLRTAPKDVTVVTGEIQAEFARRGREVTVYANILMTVILAPEIESLLSVANDIFLLSLIMGIVVVANVMLISVNERRAEIAIRRCEGARTTDIVAQFMLETGAFSAAGALLGVPLGLLLAIVRSSADPATAVSWAVPWEHIAITLACVVAGGLIAGLVPAVRAARLDPVEVLSRA